VDGWNQAAKDDYNSKLNNQSQIENIEFEKTKSKLINMIDNSSRND